MRTLLVALSAVALVGLGSLASAGDRNPVNRRLHPGTWRNLSQQTYARRAVRRVFTPAADVATEVAGTTRRLSVEPAAEETTDSVAAPVRRYSVERRSSNDPNVGGTVNRRLHPGRGFRNY